MHDREAPISNTTVTSIACAHVDLLIVTALPEERSVLKKYLPFHQIRNSNKSASTYDVCHLPVPSWSSPCNIAMVCTNAMGNTVSSTVAAIAIDELAPSNVIMFGLAGGIEGRVDLADVIVSECLWYYEPGKIAPDKLEARPSNAVADSLVLNRLHDFALSFTADYSVRFGPFAVGEKVIASESALNPLLIYAPKLIGIEMEAYGVAVAASTALSRPRFVSIRGISDFADAKKNDSHRDRALNNAAHFLLAFLQSGMLPIERWGDELLGVQSELIAIHHLSLEQRSTIRASCAASLQAQCSQLQERTLDLTCYFKNGILTDPQSAYDRQATYLAELGDLLVERPNARLGYFGLAHIPLVFAMGYQLGRKPIDLFNIDRLSGEWTSMAENSSSWPELVVDGLDDVLQSVSGNVTIRVSVSAMIAEAEFDADIPGYKQSVHLHVPSPSLDAVIALNQVNAYAQCFRQVLSALQQRRHTASVIHVYFAGPPALAFRCGQQVSKTMDSPLVVHNFSRRDQPHYRWSLNLMTGQVVDLALSTLGGNHIAGNA